MPAFGLNWLARKNVVGLEGATGGRCSTLRNILWARTWRTCGGGSHGGTTCAKKLTAYLTRHIQALKSKIKRHQSPKKKKKCQKLGKTFLKTEILKKKKIREIGGDIVKSNDTFDRP